MSALLSPDTFRDVFSARKEAYARHSLYCDFFRGAYALYIFVSANFLFRKDKKVRSVREDLIKNKALSSVIMLPPNIFIGTGVSQAALVVTKGMPNNKIIFADASGYTRF
ncbi:MAG: N-6 DNA methylase, partial [Ruminococcus sp.]|nr:N-6 DNA methylase [Ruminococcus sp.]